MKSRYKELTFLATIDAAKKARSDIVVKLEPIISAGTSKQPHNPDFLYKVCLNWSGVMFSEASTKSWNVFQKLK